MAKYADRGVILTLKSCQDLLARLGFTLNGIRLSENDSLRVANAYTLWALVTYDVGVWHGETRTLSLANLVHWLGQLREVDVSTLHGQLKEFLAWIRSMGSKPYCSFTRARKGLMSSPFYAPHMRVVAPLLYRWLKTRDADIYRSLNTWVQFILRLTLHDTRSVEEERVQSYISFEKELHERNYPDDLVADLRQVVNNLFGGLSLVGRPVFSSGATSEVPRSRGAGDKAMQPLTWAVSQFLRHHGISGLADACSTPIHYGHGTARFLLVPKGIESKRGISMEPAWSQYAQQAIFASCDNWFQNHPETRIDLHRQSLNQRLALRGSVDRSYSTIDMSDASDSITLSLVKKVCRDLPIYPDLIRTRSSKVDLGRYFGPIVEIEKFAPMGSACCFPMECIIFSAITQLANVRLGMHTYYRVYGDDIVCDTRIAEEVIYLLEQFGFTVNKEKSFVGTLFTESCGIEALCGQDVTPLRISRRWDYCKFERAAACHDASSYLGALDFINKAFETRYIMLRRYLIASVLRYFPETIFCDRDAEYGIKTHSSDLNFHLRCRGPMAARRRSSPDYQTTEWRCYVPKCIQSRTSDDVRYWFCLEQLQDTDRTTLDPDTVIQPRLGQTTVSLRKTWYREGGIPPSTLTNLRALGLLR